MESGCWALNVGFHTQPEQTPIGQLAGCCSRFIVGSDAPALVAMSGRKTVSADTRDDTHRSRSAPARGYPAPLPERTEKPLNFDDGGRSFRHNCKPCIYYCYVFAMLKNSYPLLYPPNATRLAPILASTLHKLCCQNLRLN